MMPTLNVCQSPSAQLSPVITPTPHVTISLHAPMLTKMALPVNVTMAMLVMDIYPTLVKLMLTNVLMLMLLVRLLPPTVAT